MYQSGDVVLIIIGKFGALREDILKEVNKLVCKYLNCGHLS